MTTTPSLALKNLEISFGDLKAVDNVSFEIYDGEVVGLIGENGAGKSTLLKTLAGIYKPDGGHIEVDGIPVRFKGPNDALAAGIGVVHQEQSLFTNLSVAENIEINQNIGKSDTTRFGFYRWKKINDNAAKTLAKIGSKLDPRTKVGNLSFVDRQMVEIAKAIRLDDSSKVKPIVILDEPTSLLESHETQILEREIRKLRDIGSVIFVSHRLDEVLRVCDRVLVMRDGELVASKNAKTVTQEELFKLMIGRESKSEIKTKKRNSSNAAPIVELKGAGKKRVFSGIDLKLYSGEITAIVGTNGSGREEICKSIFGADPIEIGEMRVRGQEVSDWNIQKAISQGIGFVPSERKVEGIVGELSAAANLSLTFHDDSSKGPVLIPKKQKDVAIDWFEKLDVRPKNPGLELERFSGGNQQKVVMAKWLKSPDLGLLILDHPLRGLDPGAAATVNNLIREAVENKTAVLLLADTLEEALEMADQILVMKDGKVSATYDLHTQQPSSLDLVEKMV